MMYYLQVSLREYGGACMLVAWILVFILSSQ